VTELRLLGPLELRVDGGVVDVGAPKRKALLALLALNANGPLTREQAVDALWPDDPPGRVENSLQVYVHGLRRLLGTERIETVGTGYRLSASTAEIDALAFTELLASARAAWHRRRPDRARRLLVDALALWRGEPLADVPGLDAQRGQLAEARLEALELRIEADLALGEHDRVVTELESLVRAEPYRERLRAQLMLALYRSGRQADALAAYADARRELAEDVGLEPGPALRELQRAILRQDGSLALPRAPQPLARLPRPRTPLVGRRRDVAAVATLLADPDTAVVTLTGIGGIGKTRVAIEVAAELSTGLRDGAVFVDLASTRDADDVAGAIAGTLGLPLERDAATHEALVAALANRELLVVLDNFEQVTSAAPLVAAFVGERLRVLVTSRTRLGVHGEREYPIRPLESPPPGADSVAAVAGNDAVAIVVDRAGALDPAFTLNDANAAEIAAICRAVDGVPLALELAAAATKVLTPAQIRERLARSLDLPVAVGVDRPPRHRSLRSTIDWSYELLDSAQRRLFEQLAVFRGGCTLVAFERVCGPALDDLAALLDQSLVFREHEQGREPRFRMLKIVHDYALERLDDDEVRSRHAQYFVELARDVGPELVGPGAQWASARLRDEHDNLMAALEWAVEHDVEAGFELVAAIRGYWEATSRGREVRPWLEQALPAPAQLSTRARVGSHVVYGRQLVFAGEYDAAAARFEEARAAGSRLGAYREVAFALVFLAWLQALHGAHDEARALAAEAAQLARVHGDIAAERLGLAMLADAAIRDGDHEAAAATLDASLALAERLQDRSTIVLATVNRAFAAIEAGELQAAEAMLTDALAVAEDIDEPVRTIAVLTLLATIENRTGRLERARDHLARALDLARDRGRLTDRLEVLTELAHCFAESDPARAAFLLGCTNAAYEARTAVRSPSRAVRAAELTKSFGRSSDEAVRRALAEGRRTPLATGLELANRRRP
jgi:predicted ATPase/DNA-binding SARP family transcriptional activator